MTKKPPDSTPYKIRCHPDQRARWELAYELAGLGPEQWALAALDAAASGQLKVRFTEPGIERGWRSHGKQAELDKPFYVRRTEEQAAAWEAAASKVPGFASQTGGTNVSEWCRQVLDYAATCRAEVVFRK